MFYFLALLPATGLTVAGYFVLYLSNRSEGTFRSFGKYLGFWAFTLAGLVILGALFAAAHGGRDGARIGMRGMYGPMYGPMHGPWRGDPRFCGPREAETRDAGRPGDMQPDAAPQFPAGTANPIAPSAPASPAPR